MMPRVVAPAALLASLPFAAAAQAQVTAQAEVATDDSRRGISWSEGRVAPSAGIRLTGDGPSLGARFTAVRSADRHGGAEAALDLTGGYGFDLGAVRVEADATAHLFSGARGRMDYVELGGRASYTLGPAQVEAGAAYAPDQNAIGGDNLYLFAGASAGIPLTPFTLRAGAGRSSGSADDPVLAARLRPAGRYHDWYLGVEHVTGPLVVALDYVGTDVRRADAIGPFADARHAGDRLVGRVGLAF